jgi:hypothetical protein
MLDGVRLMPDSRHRVRREGAQAVSAENRLTAEQLAALTTGDTVTLESGAEFSRRHYRTGRVVRIDPSHIVINTKGPRGESFIECYGRRDGLPCIFRTVI